MVLDHDITASVEEWDPRQEVEKGLRELGFN
jgi:hypothetical protein